MFNYAKNTLMLMGFSKQDAVADSKELVAFALNILPNQILSTNVIPTKKQYSKLNKMLKKRQNGMPVQYIVGNVEFLDLNLKVSPAVLIPRCETELLADILVKEINSFCNKIENNSKQGKVLDNKNNTNIIKADNDSKLTVLDLCSGSGAIGLSVAKATNASVTLSDISKKAIRLAKKNAKLNNLQVKFVKSNMFGKHKGKKYNYIVSNPPYISSGDVLGLQPEVVNYEPHLALDGGQLGYDFYEIIADEAKYYLQPGGRLFLEVGAGQSEQVCKLLNKDFKDINVINDYNGIQRIVTATLRGEENDN